MRAGFRRWWRELWTLVSIPEAAALVLVGVLCTLLFAAPAADAEKKPPVPKSITTYKLLVGDMPCVVVEVPKSGVAMTCDWSRLPKPAPPRGKVYGEPDEEPGRMRT